MLRFLVTVLVECKDLAMGGLVFEIYYRCGVDGKAEVTGLEVEMGAGAASCVSTECDRLAGLDTLVGFHKEA